MSSRSPWGTVFIPEINVNFSHDCADAARVCREYGFSFTRLDGSLVQRARAKAIEDFQDSTPGSPTIMLLSLKAGGVGLNLTAASQVFMMDPVSPGIVNNVHTSIMGNELRLRLSKGWFVCVVICCLFRPGILRLKTSVLTDVIDWARAEMWWSLRYALWFLLWQALSGLLAADPNGYYYASGVFLSGKQTVLTNVTEHDANGFLIR